MNKLLFTLLVMPLLLLCALSLCLVRWCNANDDLFETGLSCEEMHA